MWLYTLPRQLLWTAPQLVRCYSKDPDKNRSMFKKFQVSNAFSSSFFVFPHRFQGNALRFGVHCDLSNQPEGAGTSMKIRTEF